MPLSSQKDPVLTEHIASSTTITVLVVDDNQGDRELYVEYLEASPERFHVVSAGSLMDALEAATIRDFDVVLLDLALPDSQGLETFDRFRREVPFVPIVVATGLDDRAVGVGALQSGAQDYLVKGHVDAELLSRAIRYAYERHRLLQQLDRERAAHDREREAVAHDGLKSPSGVSSRLYGVMPLHQASRDTFEELASAYREALNTALECQIKHMDHDVSKALRSIAERLGSVGAGPRDVVELHKWALRKTERDETPTKAKALTLEGRFRILELMGHLVSFYRRYYTRSSSLEQDRLRTTPNDGGDCSGREKK